MSKIRIADYVMNFLAKKGIKTVFMVAGGGAMYLDDALGLCNELNYVCCHHEQACAMAAESYARITGSPGVIVVTTGPGGINALNGVFGAWVDSIPMLIISGQVKRETCLASYDLSGLRQLGDQEADIISMVKGITKYAVIINDPKSIKYHLEKAYHLATCERPGPCWLDIPIDVQSTEINEEELIGFNCQNVSFSRDLLASQCRLVIEKIKSASCPVIMIGNGIRIAKACDIFEKVVRKLNIPVTTAWTGIDLMTSDDPLFCGRPGTVGDRAGNFTIQNSDVLLILGSRLNIRQISYNWKSFARYAYKIHVDVDASELNKPTIKPDLAICCDVKLFLEELWQQLQKSDYNADKYKSWLKWCKDKILRYPVVLDRHRSGEKINPYYFCEVLSSFLKEDEIVVCGNGTASVVMYQVIKIKKHQRVIANSGCASMGYDLPAAIGASLGAQGKRVICIAGDGSIQMNIQELQTIVHHNLPIKIFVLNNDGYLSIRQTQKNFFGRFIGEGRKSGISFPEITKVAQAYGIPSVQINSLNFSDIIMQVLNSPSYYLCEVILDPDQGFEPRVSSRQLPDGIIISTPLEDMFPFLDPEEMKENYYNSLTQSEIINNSQFSGGNR